MARKTATKGVSDKVLRYFQNHRNVEVHVSDVADATGLTDLQVMGAVSHIRNAWGERIESSRKGWYIFRGTGSSTNSQSIVPHKAKAEVIALVGDDALLITVEGIVYHASPLDLHT